MKTSNTSPQQYRRKLISKCSVQQKCTDVEASHGVVFCHHNQHERGKSPHLKTITKWQLRIIAQSARESREWYSIVYSYDMRAAASSDPPPLRCAGGPA
mmetsp:Transcript_4237/g.7598  ORF Transcript_4237/g.7598 Transcript_4237/m.7598 type:complete len:99 (+) Transcript_4237:93-389(+)